MNIAFFSAGALLHYQYGASQTEMVCSMTAPGSDIFLCGKRFLMPTVHSILFSNVKNTITEI